MQLSLDLDGCLIDFLTPLCRRISKQIKREIRPSQVTTYRLEGLIPSDQKPWLFSLLNDPTFYRNLKPMAGAVEFVERVSKLYDVHIISARPHKLRKVTNTQVKRFFPSIKSVHLTTDKIAVAKEWDISIHLEDDPVWVLGLAESGVRSCILVQTFNRDFFAPQYDNIHYAGNYEEFEQIVTRYYKEDSDYTSFLF